LNDHIHILGGTNGGRTRIGEQQPGGSPTQEDHSGFQVAEMNGHLLHHGDVQVARHHWMRSIRARFAKLRSRARPPRMASTRASSSYRAGSSSAASGAER
jgi:hypothetical protein